MWNGFGTAGSLLEEVNKMSTTALDYIDKVTNPFVKKKRINISIMLSRVFTTMTTKFLKCMVMAIVFIIVCYSC